MSQRPQSYETDEVVVTYDPTVCRHSGACVRALPAVFDPRQKRWIRLEQADAGAVVAAVAKCPTGALQVRRKTG